MEDKLIPKYKKRASIWQNTLFHGEKICKIKFIKITEL